ncbi:DNA-binding transcriptional regulator, MerR family [Raineyella antarctica]|uniref:DNA-binding transcriptional regulator, MerR family n=2 Tax=Raineyella antarctica TaxID=1577474 RepID=A0A1G6GCK7_9ACTN|nr:DNA-binding transcriptional regulator, MerR family [Raineyella antarctica]
MHIGVVAERTGLSLRTLRHYDEIGLVHPTGRTDGGFRLYSEADVERLLLIRRMKPLGFSLQEMQDLLTLTDALAAGEAPETALQELRRFESLAAERRADLSRKMQMADEFLDRLRALSASDGSGQ